MEQSQPTKKKFMHTIPSVEWASKRENQNNVLTVYYLNIFLVHIPAKLLRKAYLTWKFISRKFDVVQLAYVVSVA